MNPNDPFDRDNLSAAETLLTEHEIAREFFQGELYQRDGISRLGGHRDSAARWRDDQPRRIRDRTIDYGPGWLHRMGANRMGAGRGAGRTGRHVKQPLHGRRREHQRDRLQG